jgi:hypothetical protein
MKPGAGGHPNGEHAGRPQGIAPIGVNVRFQGDHKGSPLHWYGGASQACSSIVGAPLWSPLWTLRLSPVRDEPRLLVDVFLSFLRSGVRDRIQAALKAKELGLA